MPAADPCNDSLGPAFDRFTPQYSCIGFHTPRSSNRRGVKPRAGASILSDSISAERCGSPDVHFLRTFTPTISPGTQALRARSVTVRSIPRNRQRAVCRVADSTDRTATSTCPSHELPNRPFHDVFWPQPELSPLAGRVSVPSICGTRRRISLLLFLDETRYRKRRRRIRAHPADNTSPSIRAVRSRHSRTSIQTASPMTKAALGMAT